MNFLGDEEPDAVRAAFGSNHTRLVELKTKLDPTTFFCLNQNVEPSDRRSSVDKTAQAALWEGQ